jgi:hypothetical protein
MARPSFELRIMEDRLQSLLSVAKSWGVGRDPRPELQRQADAEDRLDWSLHFVDSTVVRAHQHAAGAKHADPSVEALGRSRGGFSTKLHLRSERGGKPLVMVLTAGERHEQPVLSALLRGGL